MSEVGLERHLAPAHTELTAGHDVTQLLSQINTNFKKSKADQILRLLKDQDKLNDDIDEDVLEQEYNQIKEEKVTHDSDTLTDSSSESETVLNDIAEDEVESTNQVTLASNRMYRAKTAVGFYRNMPGDQGTDKVTMEEDFDTRDISVRPKSSYVRRRYRRKEENGNDSEAMTTDDIVDTTQIRPSRSARPPSRHGRASLQRKERKIEMVETEVVETAPVEQVVRRETSNTGAGGANPFHDRFHSSRRPTRESKRQKAFCDSSGYAQQTEPMCGDPPNNSMEVNEVEVEHQEHIRSSRVISNHANVSQTHVNVVPRNQHIKTDLGHTYNQIPIEQHQHYSNNAQVRNEQAPNPNSVRHDPRTTHSMVHQEIRQEQSADRHEMQASVMRHDHVGSKSSRFRRGDSNTSINRPRNPEPITSRPMDRSDVRPNTQRRRLQRRYMAQTHNPMSNVRPTSESVILARQKTEKNLLKKQAETRPQSEKIILNSTNKNILSVNENPAQGPQTHLYTKDGVAQSAHVQDYRKYDPASRLKNSNRSRDIPADLTLPRPGPNNIMLGGRKPLALMKLPPLEAALAAKKKGLALAARETCV